MNFPMRALHYNQFTGAPWNGFATLAETYNAFDPADRAPMWLVGRQKSFNTGLTGERPRGALRCPSRQRSGT